MAQLPLGDRGLTLPYTELALPGNPLGPAALHNRAPDVDLLHYYHLSFIIRVVETVHNRFAVDFG